MKKSILAFSLLSILVLGCCSAKNNEARTTGSKTAFYDGAWELEYISEPRIAFNGLYPNKKPYITFKDGGNKFNGNSSCNVYSGKYNKKEDTIHFGDVVKTMAFCEGGGEEIFLNILGKVNKLTFDSDDKLLLLIDDIPVMRFKKITKPQQ